MTSSYRPPRTPNVDPVMVESRASSFKTRSIKKGAKRQALDLVVRMIDLTTLEGMDTDGKVIQLCRKAISPSVEDQVPSVAAVCVYPSKVAVASRALAGSSVKLASVATSFPSGQSFLDIRVDEILRAVEEGADEIDMVINRGAYLAGDVARVYDEIAACKEACAHAHLKVILETGELATYDAIRHASQVAMDAGADFIKTSTGKVPKAATMPVTLVMLEAIRDHYRQTGQQIGMKPAGGIKTAKQAWHYLVMVKETLGDAWLDPNWFRFGASSLLNDVLGQWRRLEQGQYTSPRSFSYD